MKKLLLILAGAFAVFMVLAILEEWETFGGAWFGGGGDTPPPLEQSERKAAADAVYMALSLMQHFFTSGGDPRFAERMPASAAVIEELQADVDYLRRNRRRQDPSLERLEVIAVEKLAPGRVEVETRERWKIEILSIGGSGLPSGSPTEPARVQTVLGKYLVVRQDRGWRVEAWDFIKPEDTAVDGAEP